MFTIPGFDPKVLTDDQIMRKLTDLSRRIVYAQRFSTSVDMVSQLQMMSNALEFERRERIMRQIYDMRDKMFPEIIETEPDLKVTNVQETTKNPAFTTNAVPRKSKRPFSQPEVDQSGAPLGQGDAQRGYTARKAALSRLDPRPQPRSENPDAAGQVRKGGDDQEPGA